MYAPDILQSHSIAQQAETTLYKLFLQKRMLLPVSGQFQIYHTSGLPYAILLCLPTLDVNIILYLLQTLCRLCDVVHCLIVQSLCKHRQDLQPDPVSGVITGQVRPICPPAHPLVSQNLLDLLSSQKQKRTDDIPPHRPDTAKPHKSAAACQIPEHRLRLIVLVVRHRDAIRLKLPRHLVKCLIPQRPCGFLHTEMPLLCHTLCIH